jgi:hypothetical protein
MRRWAIIPAGRVESSSLFIADQVMRDRVMHAASQSMPLRLNGAPLDIPNLCTYNK